MPKNKVPKETKFNTAAKDKVGFRLAKRPTSRKWLVYLALHGVFLLYSLAAVCSKLAANQQFLSVWFVFWYVLVLAILGIYAIVWQQILRVLPLTTAYANKGVTLAWGMLWGALLFGEQIGLKTLIGAALAFIGIIIVVLADAGNSTNDESEASRNLNTKLVDCGNLNNSGEQS